MHRNVLSFMRLSLHLMTRLMGSLNLTRAAFAALSSEHEKPFALIIIQVCFFCFEKWRDKWWTWSGDMKELLRAWSFYDHREKLTGWCRLLLPFPNFSFNFFEFSSFRPKIKTQDSLELSFFFSHLIILAVELQSWRTIGVFCIVANKQTRKLWPIFTSDTRNCVFSTDKELNELTEWIPSAKTEYCAH